MEDDYKGLQICSGSDTQRSVGEDVHEGCNADGQELAKKVSIVGQAFVCDLTALCQCMFGKEAGDQQAAVAKVGRAEVEVERTKLHQQIHRQEHLRDPCGLEEIPEGA